MIFDSVIYEEEIDFYEAELALERCSYETDLACDLLYCESDNDKSDDKKKKNIIDKIIEMFKAFIDKCKKYLGLGINRIVDRVEESYTEHKIDDILKDYDNAIKTAEENGMKKFKFIEVNKLKDTLKSEADELEKAIKDFSKAYIKHGSPKDAEKMVNKIKSIGQEYEKKLNDIKSNPKDYSIKEAKKVFDALTDIRKKNNDFTSILERYQKVCDETEKLVISALNSLDKYSADTGYIQNAKTLKDIIHNSSLSIQSHTTEIVTFILKNAIPFVVEFKTNKKNVLLLADVAKTSFKNTRVVMDKYNRKAQLAGRNDLTKEEKEQMWKEIAEINKNNTLFDKYDSGKPIQNIVAKTSGALGVLSDANLKAVKKVSRKNDIKKWKETKDSDALSFDKRELSESEIKSAAKHAAVNVAKGAVELNALDIGVAIAKKAKKDNSDDKK